MMLSKWILIPLAALLGVVLLVSYVLGYDEFSFLIVPLVVVLAVVYVLSPDLDRWWMQKHPQKLPKGMVRFIYDHIPLYRMMSAEERDLFENEVSLFLKSTTFMPQGFEKVPEDLKAVVAASAHILTAFKPMWHQKFHLFQNIVLYRHPFPSPQFPNYLHSSELYIEDHVAIFSTDHFMKAFRFPQQYFNSALYEWSKVVMLDEPMSFEVQLDLLPEISGFTNEDIVSHIGLPEECVDWQAVAATYFFTFPVRFKMHSENMYEAYAEFFGVDPMVLLNLKN